MTGTAILRLYITDLNDNAPEFVLPHPPVVMEGEAPPQHVVTFSARDRDTPEFGPPFWFEMVPCNDNPSCDKRTGALAFNMTFDESKAMLKKLLVWHCRPGGSQGGIFFFFYKK